VLYDAGTLLGQAEILGTRLVQAHAALSGRDAQALNVSDGEAVRVTAGGVEVTLPAHVNGLVSPGVVAVPRNLAGRPAESLLGDERVFERVQVAKA
jgi:predicted molibdopterin-dependent oxidoreductase YjgC